MAASSIASSIASPAQLGPAQTHHRATPPGYRFSIRDEACAVCGVTDHGRRILLTAYPRLGEVLDIMDVDRAHTWALEYAWDETTRL